MKNVLSKEITQDWGRNSPKRLAQVPDIHTELHGALGIKLRRIWDQQWGK